MKGVQFALHRLGFDERIVDAAKRILVSDPAREMAHVSAKPRHRAADHRGEIGNVLRRPDPGKAGLRPAHGAPPAAHRNDREPAAAAHSLRNAQDAGSVRGKFGQFADRHSVDVRHRKLVHERRPREPLGIDRRTVHLQTAKRVWAVQHNHLHVVFEASLHRLFHRARKRVRAHADVLQIDHQRVQSRELRAGGLVGMAVVQRANPQPRPRIDLIVVNLRCGQGVIDSVFRPKERDEPHSWRAPEDIDRALPVPVGARRMGEEPDPFAPEQQEISRFEDVETRHDLGRHIDGGKADRRRFGHARGGWRRSRHSPRRRGLIRLAPAQAGKQCDHACQGHACGTGVCHAAGMEGGEHGTGTAESGRAGSPSGQPDVVQGPPNKSSRLLQGADAPIRAWRIRLTVRRQFAPAGVDPDGNGVARQREPSILPAQHLIHPCAGKRTAPLASAPALLSRRSETKPQSPNHALIEISFGPDPRDRRLCLRSGPGRGQSCRRTGHPLHGAR